MRAVLMAVALALAASCAQVWACMGEGHHCRRHHRRLHQTGKVYTGTVARWADGDTVTLDDGTKVRFHGIDAPESTQTCKDAAGAEYPCGQVSAAALRDKIGTSRVECEERDVDRFGRVVAVCRVAGPGGQLEDVNDYMVRTGMAVAYRRFTDAYVAAEEEASGARRGLWQGQFLLPWDYRRGSGTPVTADSAGAPPRAAAAPQLSAEAAAGAAPSPAADALAEDAGFEQETDGGEAAEATLPAAGAAVGGGADPACAIKGNISRSGERIYHVPGSPSYDGTRIDEAAGERWFCSEAEAQAAGWRAPGG